MATVTNSPGWTTDSAYRGILRQDERFGTGNGVDFDDRLNSAFDRCLLQSGWGISPTVFLMLCLCAGLTIGGIFWVIQENFLTTAFGFFLGMAVPVGVMLYMRARRQQKILDQLPPMVEELARASRTGRSIEQCLALVAHDTPSPLGDELKLCAQKVDLGAPIKAALRELPERTGIVSMQVLVMALVVHATTGGDLVSVLERLAATIRSRIQYVGRLRASTAASRATAILMVILPPLIVGFFLLRDPNYFQKLLSTMWGVRVTAAAVILDIIGVIAVLAILRNSERT